VSTSACTDTNSADERTTRVAKLTAEAESEGGWTLSAPACRILGSKNPATYWRHTNIGVLANGKRVVLESLVIGGKRVTTRAAIGRFLVAQQPQASQQPTNPTPAARSKAATKATKELDAALGPV
jgi:hypothetical protein